MKCGPRPSRTPVEAGASTQLRLKKELPMTKRVCSSSARLAAGNEKACRPLANTVVAPPVFSPSASSSGGAVAASTPATTPATSSSAAAARPAAGAARRALRPRAVTAAPA